MDPNNVMMQWYFACKGKLKGVQDINEPTQRVVKHSDSARRRLTRLCGYAALRLGTWLLAEEVLTSVERGSKSHRPRVASRL